MMPPINFQLNPTYSLAGDIVDEIQDPRGGHLRYQNGKVLEILNLYVAPMPSIKFRLNLTYGLGDVV